MLYVILGAVAQFERTVVSAGLRRTQFRRVKTDPPERVLGS
jgi:hypothetical protein